MARKLRIENPDAAQSAMAREELRSRSAARRQPLSISQSLRVGSRPNLAQLPSRAKR